VSATRKAQLRSEIERTAQNFTGGMGDLPNNEKEEHIYPGEQIGKSARSADLLLGGGVEKGRPTNSGCLLEGGTGERTRYDLGVLTISFSGGQNWRSLSEFGIEGGGEPSQKKTSSKDIL